MKRDDTKKNFTSLSGNDLQTVRLHYPSFPCIIAIVPVSRLLNLMRYSSVLNANIRFFCSENRNFSVKTGLKDIIGKDLITDDNIAIFELVKKFV